nr:IQ motif, EF-hand binding site, P-loop containing nucleoside triphosphate hydrolase [Tanacetum cinerariifolium]
MSAPDTSKAGRKFCSKVTPEDLPVLNSDVEELKKLVKKMEVSLTQKEHENNELKEQVRQFEARWSEQETKMKSVEETWQRQMSSLQKSLAAAKKTLSADESMDEISGTQNPDVVGHLSKEFEQKRQNFDDDARAIIGTKSGHMSYSKQIEEFKRIKDRFEMWKKEYKHQ